MGSEPRAEPAAGRALIAPTDTVPTADRAATRSIRLRVLTANGSPVAGATVRLYSGDRLPPNDAGAPTAEMTSDGLGFASLIGPSALCVAVAERSNQHTSWTPIPTGLADDAIVELRMATTIRLRGRVESAEGLPVAGARVRPHRRGGAIRTTVPVRAADAVSDAEGRFELQLGLDAIYSLIAYRDKEQSVDTNIDTGQRVDDEVVVRFSNGFMLQGRVFGLDGQPRSAELKVWECVPLTLESGARAPMATRLRASADGSYSLRLPRPGRYLVVASPLRQTRGGSAGPHVADPEMNSELVAVEVSAGATTIERDLHLARATSIAGRVRRADGRAAVACRIKLFPEATPGEDWMRGPRAEDVFPLVADVESAGDGAFVFARVQPGTTYRLVVLPDQQHPGLSVERHGLIAGSQHELVTMTDSEARGACLRLRVVFDDDDSPVPSCRIDYVVYERGQPVSATPLSITTDGAVLVSPRLGCGREFGLTIRDRASHMAEDELVCSPIHVGPIVLTHDDERIVRVPRAVDISVHVRNAEGHPCIGARVALRPVTARASGHIIHAGETDAQGAIRFRGCETGPSRLLVGRDERTELELAVDVRSGLNPGVRVELR
jgi:hypothetical protein